MRSASFKKPPITTASLSIGSSQPWGGSCFKGQLPLLKWPEGKLLEGSDTGWVIQTRCIGLSLYGAELFKVNSMGSGPKSGLEFCLAHFRQATFSLNDITYNITWLYNTQASPGLFTQATGLYREAVLCCSVMSLCNFMNCSPPGSSIQGISQARILEWVAISSSRGSSQPRDEPTSPALAGGFKALIPRLNPPYTEPPGKPLRLLGSYQCQCLSQARK